MTTAETGNPGAPVGSWWIGETARAMRDAAALRVNDTRVSFTELAAASEDVAAALAGAGVSRGDRVALIAPASQRVVEIIHAAQRIGAALVPINPRLTASEIAELLATTRPRIVVADDSLVAAVSPTASGATVYALSDLERSTRARLESSAATDPHAPHSLLCTSGTTGEPKAVVLSHANHHASAVAAGRRLGYRAHQSWLSVLPLHHVGGLAVVLRAAIVGAEVVLHAGFEAKATSRELAQGDLAHASLVPTMLYRLLPELVDGAALAGARSCCFLVGGAALDEKLAVEAQRLGLDVRATYGLTEAASQVTTTERGELGERAGTSGRPLDGIDVRIDSPDREGFGEVHVRGPQVSRGALQGEWLRTGDIARTDAQGFLFVGSRRVDLIVTGGENVRPEEVERVLESHPAIAEAGVYGLPDAEWGHRVAAVVVPRAGARIDADEIVAWCKSRLAPHKRPRAIDTTASLPRTASGKLQRRKLGAGF
jgi:O-succinylbenzoic acid--CoA ligase